jgi:hypothetical protein
MSSLNPLLEKVKLPGRVFSLPSKGQFYKAGEVLDSHVKDGEIQVKPMSALTEVKLRSADLLLSGKIIREVCLECAPEILVPEKLINKDIDALFVFLVASTYGSAKKIQSIHNCKKAEVHEYTISLDTILVNPRNDCLVHKDMMYQVDLNNGQRVILNPVKFQDSMDIMLMRQELARKQRDNIPVETTDYELLIIADLLCVIEAVEDTALDGKIIRVTDRNLIAEWARALTKKHTDMIIKAANESAEWGFEFKVPVTCKDCGEEYSHEIELNPVNFFSG